MPTDPSPTPVQAELNRFDVMLGEDANQPLVPARTVTVPVGTPLTLQPNIILQPNRPPLVLPTANVNASPIPSNPRIQNMGIKISELDTQLKIKGWFWQILTVNTVTLDDAFAQVIGMGDSQILGYDANSPSTNDDPEEQYGCKLLYVRSGSQSTVTYKQLRKWLNSLTENTRLHATDGRNLWPVVGVRFSRISSYSNSDRYNMNFSLGSAL